MDSNASSAYNMRLSIWRSGAILGVLLIAIIVVEAPKDIALILYNYQGCGGWILLSFVLMAALPFLLAKIAPRVADFDRQWLPSARLHWLWFAAMILLLLAVKEAAQWLMSFHGGWFFRNNSNTDVVVNLRLKGSYIL